MDRVLSSVTCHGHRYVQVIKVLRKLVYIVHCWNTQMSESDCASKLRQIICCKQTHFGFQHSTAAQWLNRTYCEPKQSNARGILSCQHKWDFGTRILSTADVILFWCPRVKCAQVPVVRRLKGRKARERERDKSLPGNPFFFCFLVPSIPTNGQPIVSSIFHSGNWQPMRARRSGSLKIPQGGK